MNILVDTNILLRLLDRVDTIPAEAAELLAAPEHEVFFSSVAIWEIAIKAGLRRADFPHRPERILEMATEIGYAELPIRAAVAATVADLPWHHRDPFDRLLVAQAIEMPARLYTSDPRLTAYSQLVTLVR